MPLDIKQYLQYSHRSIEYFINTINMYTRAHLKEKFVFMLYKAKVTWTKTCCRIPQLLVRSLKCPHTPIPIKGHQSNTRVLSSSYEESQQTLNLRMKSFQTRVRHSTLETCDNIHVQLTLSENLDCNTPHFCKEMYNTAACRRQNSDKVTSNTRQQKMPEASTKF